MRVLMDHETAHGQATSRAAMLTFNQSDCLNAWVEGSSSDKPMSLARPSYPFEKPVLRRDGKKCRCCGMMAPHDAVIVGGSTVCAWHRVQRGGIAVFPV